MLGYFQLASYVEVRENLVNTSASYTQLI